MLEARKSTLRSALDGIILVHMMGGGTVDGKDTVTVRPRLQSWEYAHPNTAKLPLET